MLLDSVLDDLRAMAHVAQVAVDPADEAVAAVAQLAADREEAHRRAA